MPRKLTRRRFLRTSAGLGACTILPARVLGGPLHKPPNEKLNIAAIGIGGIGRQNLNELADENIVALCDVDREYAKAVMQARPDTPFYSDYRVMLERQKDIDAVLIATPDHTHAVIALAAIQCGKHVYCQKPLAHDIAETRAVVQAAARARIVTQMGIQAHSTEPLRLLVEWIRAGAIGNVLEVDAWCLESYYPWGKESWSPPTASRPTQTPPTPESLEWDLWLGPARQRPYHTAYHPQAWRAWIDFGTGWLGDRGVHTLDPIVWSLDLGAPQSIEATTLGRTEDTYPIGAIVTYRFPARGAAPPVKLTWYDGLRPPRPPELEPGRKMGDAMGGAIIRGDKGVLMCGTYGGSPRLLPESRMKEYQRPAPSLPRIRVAHEQNWAQACKGLAEVSAPFDYGGRLTEICLLGNIALRVEGVLEWDAEKMRFSNSADANALIAPEYRQGWSR